MTVGLNRKRRPPPIRLPQIDRRQLVQEDVLNANPKETPTPILVPTPSPTRKSTASLLPSLVSPPNVATTTGDNLSPVQETSAQIATRSTLSLKATSLRLTSNTQQSFTKLSTTNKQSPTRTTFVTVTQTLKSPKEKQETPGATQTVFISGAPQIVTVTAAPQVTDPAADNGGISNKPKEIALPSGAAIPLIILGTVAGISSIVIIAIVLWRRRKKRIDRSKEKTAE